MSKEHSLIDPLGVSVSACSEAVPGSSPSPAPIERPILFSGPMVRAILEGKKTQTRRVVKPQPVIVPISGGHDVNGLPVFMGNEAYAVRRAMECGVLKCPYGKVGDRLWVRETFMLESGLDGMLPYIKPDRPYLDIPGDDYEISDNRLVPHYRATDENPELVDEDREDEMAQWRPSIHMPRWASRILLEITEVRVQRLQEISGDDARAEGCDTWPPPITEYNDTVDRQAFRELWNSINTKTNPWESNPWIWCLSFRRIDGTATAQAHIESKPDSPLTRGSGEVRG